MSNNKISKIISQNKFNKEKYYIFKNFLNNLNQYKSLGDSLDIDIHQNYLQKNKINTSKYTKIDGSKSFLLDTLNSLITKDDLFNNLDNSKTIMDNLDFIPDNSKYINDIKCEQDNSQNYTNKNNLFSSPKTNSIQKNLFFINKENICPDNDCNNNIFLSESTINNINENNIEDIKKKSSESNGDNKDTYNIIKKKKRIM